MFLPKMFLHIFHTCRSQYRRVLVKCCTNEILFAHRFFEIRGTIDTHTPAHTHKHLHIPIHTYTHSHTQTHTNTHTHTHTYTQTSIYRYTHSHTHTQNT